MTLEQAQAQYDLILESLGVSSTEFQSRRMDYAVGDARLKELAFLEDKISQLTNLSSGTSSSRSTYAKFSRG